jgi:hypothetical protein
VAGGGICHDLRRLFEAEENATQEEKDRKELLRRCYNTFVGKHQALDKDTTNLYREPTKLEACGLNVKGLETKHNAKL